MPRRLLPVLACALALVACSADEDPTLEPAAPGDVTSTTASTPATASDVTSTSSATNASETSLPGGATGGPHWTFTLTGASEAPNAGDPDGRGTATVVLVPERSELCYSIAVEGIEPATEAHIHRGPEGESGPVVLNLAAPGPDGSSEGCAAADQILIGEIEASPGNFYLNVHNEPFPQGAVRGQLGEE